MEKFNLTGKEREVVKNLGEKPPEKTNSRFVPTVSVSTDEVREFAEKFLELGISLDFDESNLGYDKNGNIVFVEPIPAYFAPPIEKKPIIYNFDYQKLESAIKQLDEEASMISMDYLRRLKQICLDEETIRNKKLSRA